MASLPILSSVNDYIYPYFHNNSYSNYGTIGLIQNPTARFNKAGTIGFSWSHRDPYINGSILAYPFDWLEASYQYTDINNALYSRVKRFSGNQSYKDKGFDFKFMLFKESLYIPQVAVGFRDAAGTSKFASEYLVLSKFYRNFDFTFGIGWGNLNGNKIQNPLESIHNSFKTRPGPDSDTQGGEFSFSNFMSGDAGYFGGVEIFLPNMNGSRLKLELDGTDYENEGFPDGVFSSPLATKPIRRPDSKLNFEFVYPVNKFFQLKLGYTKGNTINFGFSFTNNFSRKNSIIKKNDPIKDVPYKTEIKKLNSGNFENLVNTTLYNLQENQIYPIKANLENGNYSVVFKQSQYLNHTTAMGRAFRIINQLAPDEVKEISLVNYNAGLPLYEAKISRESLNLYEKDKLYKLTSKDLSLNSTNDQKDYYGFIGNIERPTIFWGFEPSIRSQIGGPDGFFFGDLRLDLKSEIIFDDGITLTSRGSIGLLNNFDDLRLASDSVLPHVRTDIVKYLKESDEFYIQNLQFNIFKNPLKDVYAKFSMGIFEEMFGGYGGEILYRPFDKNYGIGIEGWHAFQRDYNMRFDFQDYDIVSGHVNLYYHLDPLSVDLLLKGGRFLAGDSGVYFDFSRRFRNGLRIGAFFALTDISKQEFGEGSFDKGFYFYVPVDMFSSKHRNGHIPFGLRPLTRDGAAWLLHSFQLWGVTDASSKNFLFREMDSFYD
tara:strand:- start:1585 stop:3723 length:2139 start_codon:yes stop_codon:yes gene_type:complete